MEDATISAAVDDDFQALQPRRNELQEGRQESNRAATTRLAVTFLDLSGPHVRARDALIRLAGAGWDLNYTKLRRYFTKHWTSITYKVYLEKTANRLPSSAFGPYFRVQRLLTRPRTSILDRHRQTLWAARPRRARRELFSWTFFSGHSLHWYRSHQTRR